MMKWDDKKWEFLKTHRTDLILLLTFIQTIQNKPVGWIMEATIKANIANNWFDVLEIPNQQMLTNAASIRKVAWLKSIFQL